MAAATADLPIRATGLNTYYGASHILRGIDFGSVPIPKTFSVALSAKF